MEATHFIEVYKSGWGKNLRNTMCNEISEMVRYLKETDCKRTLETIAVWRIKPSDVPLSWRMLNRDFVESNGKYTPFTYAN